MREPGQAYSAKLAWRRVVTAFSLALLVLTTSAGAAETHEDGDAGVRFSVPFAPWVARTAAQVEALILHHPEARIPEGVRYTSGAYAEDGLPFVLVWTLADAEPPTRRDLRELADGDEDDKVALTGLEGLRFDAKGLKGTGTRREGNGLYSRVVMQVAAGRTIFVGLFDRAGKPEVGDEEFRRMAESVELTDPSARIDVAALPSGTPWVTYVLAGLGVLAMGGAGAAMVGRARPRG